MDTFKFDPHINLSEEEKRLLAVTSFEANESVSKRTDENNSFLFTMLGHWTPKGGGETINKIQELLEFRSQNDIELHVKEIGKSGQWMDTGTQI